jgi:LEA14-like dessication related protein
MSKPLLSCAVGLLLAACAQSPIVTLTDIRPLEFGLLEQSYLIKLRIQNPNAFDLPIEGLSYQLEINDQPFARGVSRRLLTVPSYGSELIEVEAFSSLAEIFQHLSQLRKGRASEIRYRLVGKLSATDRLSPLSFDQRSELVLPMARETSPKEE